MKKAIIASGRATLHGSYKPCKTIAGQGNSLMMRAPSDILGLIKNGKSRRKK